MINAKEQEITFRRATIADSLAVGRVHVQSWRESFKGIVPQSFLDQMSVQDRATAFRTRFTDDDYRMFIAETPKNEVIGFADFGRARETDRPYKAELYAIYLLREAGCWEETLCFRRRISCCRRHEFNVPGHFGGQSIQIVL
jgi:hypothetical protein